MKHILIFFALLFCSVSYGQIQDWNIKIRSSQDTDSTYVMMSDTAGQYAGRGRWYSLAILADLIEGYISSGGISDGDKGDITVSGSGATWNIDANTIGATEIAVTGVTAGTYNYPGSIKVDADGRIELISSLGDPPLTSEVDGDISNEGSLTVEAGGATTSEIHSNTSGSTDVTLNAAWGLDISENTGTGNITYIADSSQVATQYDLTQISGTADADWYERGTGAPANSITDSIYTSGIVAISETTPSKMLGHLTIGEEGNSVVGLAINNMLDGESAIGIYPSGTYTDGWEFELSDMADFFIRNKISSVATTPFRIDSGTPSHTLYLAGNGNVTISDYPNSRDDGTPTNVLGTDINGVIQSYPVADVQPTTEAIQDIIGAMFTGNTETGATVDYQDADGTIDVVVTGSSSSPYVITPAQLTSDQDNYAPTGIGRATYIYVDSDNGMRAITGIADSTAGTLEKTIINDGSYMIYLPMSHPDSDAAHRFVGWPGDYYIYPGHSVKILYDLVANNWRILGGDLGYAKPTVYYSWSAGSNIAGDYGDLILTNYGGTGTGTPTASTTSLPGYLHCSTYGSTTGRFGLGWAKSIVTYTAFSSAHQFVESTISIPTLSDGTETFFVQVQVTTSPAGTSMENNNSICVRYNQDVNSGKWELYTQNNAGTETVTDLGVTVASGTLYKIRIEVDKANSEARVFINNAFSGRITGTMPNSVVTGSRVFIWKTSGSTTRSLYVHSFSAGAIYPY